MRNAKKMLTKAENGLLSDILGIVALVTLLLGALHLPAVT